MSFRPWAEFGLAGTSDQQRGGHRTALGGRTWHKRRTPLLAIYYSLFGPFFYTLDLLNGAWRKKLTWSGNRLSPKYKSATMSSPTPEKAESASVRQTTTTRTDKLDDAAVVDVDPVVLKKLLRKCDWHLLPPLTAVYFLSFMDRTNIGTNPCSPCRLHLARRTLRGTQG